MNIFVFYIQEKNEKEEKDKKKKKEIVWKFEKMNTLK